jgi:hypothetical protein
VKHSVKEIADIRLGDTVESVETRILSQWKESEGTKAWIILCPQKGRDRSFERPRHRWEENIELNLKEIEHEYVDLDSTGSGYGPLVGCYEHCNEPSGYIQEGKFLEKFNSYELHRGVNMSWTVAFAPRNLKEFPVVMLLFRFLLVSTLLR